MVIEHNPFGSVCDKIYFKTCLLTNSRTRSKLEFKKNQFEMWTAKLTNRCYTWSSFACVLLSVFGHTCPTRVDSYRVSSSCHVLFIPNRHNYFDIICSFIIKQTPWEPSKLRNFFKCSHHLLCVCLPFPSHFSFLPSSLRYLDNFWDHSTDHSLTATFPCRNSVE